MADQENEKTKEPIVSGSYWSEVIGNFLNEPPTASIFRLYILCFILWNEKLILYIIFSKTDMASKLLYGYSWMIHFNYWLGSWPELSMYFGPMILMLIIYFIVLFPIFRNSRGEKESLFYYLLNLHLDYAKKERKTKNNELLSKAKDDVDLLKTISRLEEEKSIIKTESDKRIFELTEEADKNKKNKKILEQFEEFELRKASFKIFIELAYYVRRNDIIKEFNLLLSSSDYEHNGKKFKQKTIDELRNNGLVIVDTVDYNSTKYYIDLTKKGIDFLNIYDKKQIDLQ